MFLGLRSDIRPAPDLDAAREWYTAALGVEPYFENEAYVGYSFGGFELGLFKYGDPAAGPLPYWGVADLDAALASLTGSGATMAEEIHEVGGGIRMAAVTDPHGVHLGLIENPVFELTQVDGSGPGR